jgi:flagellar protein FliT
MISMTNLELMEIYENVALITDKMLNAAKSEDWDLLIELETHCSTHVKTLQMNETQDELTEEMRQRKVNVIKKILADDREIRVLTEPWMEQLSQIMQSSQSSRLLTKTYGMQQNR